MARVPFLQESHYENTRLSYRTSKKDRDTTRSGNQDLTKSKLNPNWNWGKLTNTWDSACWSSLIFHRRRIQIKLKHLGIVLLHIHTHKKIWEHKNSQTKKIKQTTESISSVIGKRQRSHLFSSPANLARLQQRLHEAVLELHPPNGPSVQQLHHKHKVTDFAQRGERRTWKK